jgi:iron complex outermembrane recepter protein
MESMNSNMKLSCAIAAILGGSVGGAAQAATATGTDTADTSSDTIQEITVTAQRRAENIQDVPITMQALTGEVLTQLNVQTFDEFIKYLPNVTQGTYGPGQGQIYMRGLGQGALGVQGEGAVGIFPNVAVYLDEQSAQLPSRNLDVYAADMERIEVLEGPQGTVFGAGAQAGVVRYITNKPKLDVTEGSVDADYGTTAHGGNNSSVVAVLNLPLIDNTLAIRGVIYDDNRGGYIDNVPSGFSRSGYDLGLALYNGGKTNFYGKVTSPGVVPANSETINNASNVGNGINPLTYQGIRVGLAWKVNDQWDALLQQSYQDMNAQGVFYDMPSTGGGQYGPTSANFNPSAGLTGGTPLSPLQVSLFNPSYNKDKFENTALTVNGNINNYKIVYAGSYLIRNVDQQTDYTNYARGKWGYYYQCTGFSKSYDAPSKCYSPSSVWTDTEKLTHLSQELRVSSPDEYRLRVLGGVFYEDYKIDDNTEWLYRTVPNCSAALTTECYLPIQPPPGQTANDPSVRNSSTGFFDDVQRGFDQKALFTSVDFDIIPKVLTLTGGTRYFHFDDHVAGGDVGSFYCKFYGGYSTTNFSPCSSTNNNGFNANFFPGPPGSISGYHPGPYGYNFNASSTNHTTENGFRSRGNLTWKIAEDVMVYYTYSEGYRPGGFNRGTNGALPQGYVPGVSTSSKCGSVAHPLACQYYTPLTWQSDNLINQEIGWKTEWFSHRLQLNGAIYREKWDNVQTSFFDPQQGLGNLTFNTNGPNYRVRGIELQIVGQPILGLTITSSMAWNSSELVNSPALTNNNPNSQTPASGGPYTGPNTTSYGQVITSIPNVYGAPGSRLAMSPPFEGNIRARYEWPFGDYRAFIQGGANHIGETLSQTGNVTPFVMPGYTTYDASAGISKDRWTLTAYGQNLSDNLASTYTSSNQFVVTQTVLRPRVLGVRFGYKFGEGK